MIDTQKSRAPLNGAHLQRDSLRLAAFVDRTEALGPGVRFALWLQGCPFACPGCIAPDFLPNEGGEDIAISALIERIEQQPDIEGITVSGGEPFRQALALAEFLERLPARLSIILFTGYTAAELSRRAGRLPEIRAILRHVDVLVDGRYVHAENDSRGLRGSHNQTVHFLSARYRHLREWFETAPRVIEHHSDENADMLVGIPPLATWRELIRSPSE